MERLFLVVVLLGCSCQHPDPVDRTGNALGHKPAPVAPEPGMATARPNPRELPVGDPKTSQVVGYSIINESRRPGIKHSIDVRLSREATEGEITRIATSLKQRETETYARTFICFYLEGMEPGHGAWATGHFDPSLKVVMLGAPARGPVLPPVVDGANREILGEWVMQPPLVGGRVSIYRERGKAYMRTVYRDGSQGFSVVSEQRTSAGLRLNKAGSRDYWVLNISGNLEVWDQLGHVGTAVKAERK